MRSRLLSAGRLFFRFLMVNVLTAKSTELLQFQAFRCLLFVLGTVVIDAIALGALKMNCLAHVLFSLALPRLTSNGVTEDFR